MIAARSIVPDRPFLFHEDQRNANKTQITRFAKPAASSLNYSVQVENVFSDLKTSSGTHLLYQDPSLSTLVTTLSRFSLGKPSILFASFSSVAKSFPNPPVTVAAKANLPMPGHILP